MSNVKCERCDTLFCDKCSMVTEMKNPCSVGGRHDYVQLNSFKIDDLSADVPYLASSSSLLLSSSLSPATTLSLSVSHSLFASTSSLSPSVSPQLRESRKKEVVLSRLNCDRCDKEVGVGVRKIDSKDFWMQDMCFVYANTYVSQGVFCEVQEMRNHVL